MRDAGTLSRMLPCLRAVSPREEVNWGQLTRETCLISHLWLHAPGIVQLGELLEEEFGVTLTAADLVGVALDNPTLGGLTDMVEAKLRAA